MKLIYCLECTDVVALQPEAWRACQCGLSRGRYIRTPASTGSGNAYRLAEVEGPLQVLGLLNADLRGTRRRIRTFVIPPSDPWVTWADGPGDPNRPRPIQDKKLRR
jgi:hypothetical protein